VKQLRRAVMCACVDVWSKFDKIIKDLEKDGESQLDGQED